MPDISMIEKVVRQVCAISLPCKQVYRLDDSSVYSEAIFLFIRIYLWNGAAEHLQRMYTHRLLLGCIYIGFLNLFEGRGPGINTVSKIGVYETIMSKFF